MKRTTRGNGRGGRSRARSAASTDMAELDLDEVAADVDDPLAVAEEEPAAKKPAKSRTNSKRNWMNKLLAKNPLELKCLWSDCDFRNNEVGRFIDHVATHSAQMIVVKSDDNNIGFQCSWGTCGYIIPRMQEGKMHIAYHGFHKYLSTKGAMVIDAKICPPCLKSPALKDCLPSEVKGLEKLTCLWQDCSEEFINPYNFYCHTRCHANYADTCEEDPNYLVCSWEFCQRRVKSKSTMQLHVQSHTFEKCIACPVCAIQYVDITRFTDHCDRQMDVKDFVCSQCQKAFPTERLQRSHEQSTHLLNYKCPYCDKRRPSPSSLKEHILSIHLPTKSAACELCSFVSKKKRDLLRHMDVHFSKPKYNCTVENCDKGWRSKTALKKHMFTVHNIGTMNYYVCHICKQRYFEGRLLTLHLDKKHDFKHPEKIKYVQEPDGTYMVDPNLRGPVFIAFDQLDPQGSVASKVLIATPQPEVAPQILTLPMAVQEPQLSELKAVPISTAFPPMFVMQSALDEFKAANKHVASFEIVTNPPKE